MFENLVKNTFGYLKSDYEFTELKDKIGYKCGDLEIEFYADQGEIDIVLFVRRDDDIFKPFISRSFDLLKVARKIKGSRLEVYRSEAEYFVTSEEINKYLNYCSQILQKYCIDLLKGRLGVLEEIHLERRINA